jgi:hypothetical protein
LRNCCRTAGSLLTLRTKLYFSFGQYGLAGRLRSIAYAVEYVPSNDATPRWPVLHTGFVGDALDKGQGRLLNISLPQHPRGGPVLDEAGRLIGMALGNGSASDQIVLTSQLYQRLGNGLGPMPQASAERQRASVDQIYEAALRSSLQVIGIQSENGSSAIK